MTRVLTAALWPLLAAALGAPPAAWAEAPAIASSVEPAEVAVGDRVRLAIEVEHDEDASVVWPAPDALGPFEVLERRIDEPRAEGGRTVSRAAFVLAAFELGDLQVPAVEIEVVDAAGDAVALETAPAAVTVSSVGLDASGDIRAIKGPLDMPRNLLLLLPWLLGATLLAAAAWWLWRRRPGAPESIAAPVVPVRPPHAAAYEAFRILEAERLPERGEIKAFHIRAADILRAYVEGRYGVDALEMTTAEVMDGLRRREIGGEVRADLRRLLERCDLVKFAKDRPAAERCCDVIPLGRAVVDRTRLADLAPAAAADATPAEAGAG